MKIYKILLLTITSVLLLTGCATKVQNEVLSSNKEEISKLLTELINKEKEIIQLKENLENCKESK